MRGCACSLAFPPREFETAREADSFLSNIRKSPLFRFVEAEDGATPRERFQCVTCRREWLCRIPPRPPLQWGPREAPAPADQRPAHRHEKANDEGLVRASLAWCDVLFKPDHADDVPSVARSLLDWWPGLRRWRETGGFREIEIEVGPRLANGWPVIRQFEGHWDRRRMDPAWRSLKSTSAWRRVSLRAIRSRRVGALFRGEEALIVIDLKAESVMAWMMRETR